MHNGSPPRHRRQELSPAARSLSPSGPPGQGEKERGALVLIARRILRSGLCQNLVDDIGDIDAFAADSYVRGIDSGHLKQIGGQLVELACLLLNQRCEFRPVLIEPAKLDETGTGRLDGSKRSLERVSQSVENCCPKLLAVPGGLCAALVLERPRSLDRDRGKQSNARDIQFPIGILR